MRKTTEIRVKSTDLEKMIAFFSVITEAVKDNAKIRIVLEHDSEKDMSVIEIFKKA